MVVLSSRCQAAARREANQTTLGSLAQSMNDAQRRERERFEGWWNKQQGEHYFEEVADDERGVRLRVRDESFEVIGEYVISPTGECSRIDG
jgi:hypothetical protein